MSIFLLRGRLPHVSVESLQVQPVAGHSEELRGDPVTVGPGIEVGEGVQPSVVDKHRDELWRADQIVDSFGVKVTLLHRDRSIGVMIRVTVVHHVFESLGAD